MIDYTEGAGTQYHRGLKPGDIGEYVILPGDPGRVDAVGEFLTDIEFRRQVREFHSMTGKYNGKRVTVLSTGIGCDNIDIVVTELDALANIDFNTREVKTEHRTLTILRIGTSGAIQPDIPLGAFVFTHYSAGCDGLINWYADRDDYSDASMEKSFTEHTHWDRHLPAPYFIKASEELIDRFKDCTVKGVTVSASGFYGPQGRVIRIQPAMPRMLEDFESWRYGDYRITNFEMESSALSGLAAHLGHKGGTVCCIIANRHLKNSRTDYKTLIRNLVKLALDRLTA